MMEQPPCSRTTFDELLRLIERADLSERQPMVERRLMHYSSSQSILLVGEGNFSFSSALATAFECAQNIVATTLDSKEKVLRVYDTARSSIWNLESRRGLVLYEVDATRLHQIGKLRASQFDRIVFNLPHAGFIGGGECSKEAIKKNNELVSMFFKSATEMLRLCGEIHVTNKVGPPYKKWTLEGEAEKYGLYLKESVSFQKTDYPGYMNKRGSGRKINRTFRLGECKTYMFSMV
ncbi:heavy metal-associated isoprenylated plant protein 41 isoform X2 [Cryptomeria japonica]|uniref:heavy metal-associated isoprenylated plant protein 41 isoform X2 n=1 Tax=Cryptomeria japonica TaxID=3369 RepID=UPI0025AD0707|nr:heavy metal-associated isoprenylated plant protein 41 isoform X2 [Cryptomeria japonica]